MTKQTVTIYGRLPSLNEVINTHWANYYRKKKTTSESIMWEIKEAGIVPVQGKARVTIQCYEQDHRRDEDNVIATSGKIILDALVKMGIIHNDSPKWCRYIPMPVQYDKDNPRIVVEVEEKDNA